MRVLPGSCPVPARFLPDGRAGTASVGRFLRSEPGSNRRTTLGCCTTLVRTLPRRCGAWCGWDDLRYGMRNSEFVVRNVTPFPPQTWDVCLSGSALLRA